MKLKFLKHGSTRSKNTTGELYDSGPLKEQQDTETARIEMHQSQLLCSKLWRLRRTGDSGSRMNSNCLSQQAVTNTKRKFEGLGLTLPLGILFLSRTSTIMKIRAKSIASMRKGNAWVLNWAGTQLAPHFEIF